MGIALAVASGIIVGLCVYYKPVQLFYKAHKRRRMNKRLGPEAAGLAILAERLENQRKAQLRHIKERDAADSELFDKVEEARRDFE